MEKQILPGDCAAERNEQLTHSLWDIHHKMRQLHDGKASQSRILIILREHGTMTQKALTEHLGIHPGSASEIITKLENAGLIVRVPNESDRRTADLVLTEKGKGLAKEAAEQMRTLYSKMFACLTDEEKDALLSLLEKLQADWDDRFALSKDSERT